MNALTVDLRASDCCPPERPWGGAVVYVFGRSAAGFRIAQPLPVRVEHTDDGYVVSDTIFDVYGEGTTWGDAEADFVASLVDYYLMMADSRSDAATGEIVRHLETYIRPA